MKTEDDHWVPSDHVVEFIELAKELLFIVQGNPKAPVTPSNLVNKISDHIKTAGSCENIIFWNLEQLSLTEAIELLFVVFDAFYSVGKSEILKYIAKKWSLDNKTVYYLIHKSKGLEEDTLPFTHMMYHEFQNTNIQVKETTFELGTESFTPLYRLILDYLKKFYARKFPIEG